MTWTRIVWTPAADAELARLCAQTGNRSAVARTLGVSVWAVEDRMKKLGIAWPKGAPAVAFGPAPLDTASAGARCHRLDEALPAGHPTSWGAITAGTCLAGSVYR